MSRSLRHRAQRRRTVPWIWWQVPTISPYIDRLAARAMPHCELIICDGITDRPARVLRW